MRRPASARSVAIFFLIAFSRADPIAECTAQQCSAEGRPEEGAALLQVSTGAGSLKKRAAVAATTEADDQLAQYTKLKEALSQDEDSASIMRKIDDALDWRPAPDAATNAKAGHLPSKGAAAAKPLPAVSLIDTGSGTTQYRPKEDIEEDGEEEEEAEDNNEGDGDEDEENENDESEEAEEEEEEEDEEDSSNLQVKAKKKQTRSLVSAAAGRQSLDEDGYLAVAGGRSNQKMELFVSRLVEDMGLDLVDVGGLKGMVPFYSGQKSTQSFEALQSELLDTAKKRHGWLQKSGFSSRKTHGTKVRAKKTNPLLLQTEQTQHEARKNVSLLGQTMRVMHKVSDFATEVLGSGTLILLATMGLVACVFCLDERKRTGGKGKHIEYENPLNLSPEPPPMKGAQSDVSMPGSS